MHRISRRMVVVVALVGALAAGGAAYTASVAAPGSSSSDGTAGYGQVSVNGATLSSVAYAQDNTPGDADFGKLTGATLVFTGDLTSSTVTAQFDGNTGSEVACGSPTLVNSNADTQFTCTFPSAFDTSSSDSQLDV